MRKRYLIIALLVLVAIGAAFGFFWSYGSREQSLHVPGVVEIQEVQLGSKIGGRVEDVFVTEGQRVKAGDKLVTFEAPELKAQRGQVLAKLREAELDYQKARDGPRPQEIEAARQAAQAAEARYQRLYAGPRVEEKDQAQSDFDAAEADVKLSKEEYDRARRLFTQRAIGQGDLDIARANLDRAEGRARAAKARLTLLLAGYRQEEIDEAAAELRRTNANYDLLKEGTRKEDILAAEQRVADLAAKLAELDANLAEAVVTAKESVIIEVLGVRKGHLVAPNQPILRILRDDDIWVKAYVPETQLDRVKLGQEVEVTSDSGDRFKGTVIKIASESEFTPRNVQSADERRHQVFGIKVRVDDPRGILKPGMAAEVIVPR